MQPNIEAQLAANGGCVKRAELLDCGLSPHSIRCLLDQGHLVVLRRGIYANGVAWAALDPHRAQPRLQTRAAVHAMHRGFVISHDSAAHELGMDILRPPDPHVHITRPGFTGAWTKAGVKHHLARFVAEQVVEVDGFRVLNLARTAVDIAREHGPPYGEVACDSAMRLGAPRQALVDAYEPMRSWPHVRRTRVAVDFADAGAETVAETLGRMLVKELGIGDPKTQFPVSIGHGVAWCDLRVGSHLFEVDGRIKYLPIRQGGVAERPIAEVLWEEKKRQRLVCAEGVGMSRIIWEDFWTPHREAAKLRLRAEYDVTARRFGERLPEHLTRFAREMKGRRGA